MFSQNLVAGYFVLVLVLVIETQKSEDEDEDEDDFEIAHYPKSHFGRIGMIPIASGGFGGAGFSNETGPKRRSHLPH